MSRASTAANSVVSACEDVCQLYRIPCFRQQSRVFTVTGVNGKPRPMVIGQWRDEMGVTHTSGMADLLIAPRIRVNANIAATVFLWCECKYGSGELSPDQQAFKTFVEANGMYHVKAQDSADAVIEWLKLHNVIK